MKGSLSVFWQSAILTAVVIIAMMAFYLIFGFINSFGYLRSPFTITIVYALSSLLYIPAIIFAQTKNKTNLFTEVKLPKPNDIGIIFIIAVLLFIILIPLKNPIDFFKLLSTNQIKTVMTFPVIDLGHIIKLLHAVILGPIVEELFFRGVILKNFLEKYSPTAAILGSSLLFSLAHVRYIDFASLFIYGCIFGLVYYKTKSITNSILLHGFGNLINHFYVNANTEIVKIDWLMYLVIYVLCIILFVGSLKYLKLPQPVNHS